MINTTHYNNEAQRCRKLALSDPGAATRWRELAEGYDFLAASVPTSGNADVDKPGAKAAKSRKKATGKHRVKSATTRKKKN